MTFVVYFPTPGRPPRPQPRIIADSELCMNIKHESLMFLKL